MLARLKYSKILVVIGLAVFFRLAIDPSLLFENVEFFIFQSRDLQRALRLLAGELIFFGPEMTGGGHLPGPLYYLVLASFLAVQPLWLAPWYGLMGVIFLSGLAVWKFFKANLSLHCAFLWFVLFAVSPRTSGLIVKFLNVSFVLPLIAVALVLIGGSYSAVEKKLRKRYFIAACLVIGIGLQFHFSIITLLIALLLIQLLAKKIGLEPHSGATVLSGVGLFFLPSLPYGVWWLLNQNGIAVGQDELFAGSFGRAPQSLLALTQSLVFKVPADFFSEAFGSLMRSLPLPLFILGLTLFVRDKDSRLGEKEKSFLTSLIVVSVVSFFPFSYCFFAPIGWRYGIPFDVSVIVITVMLFYWVQLSQRRLRVYNWAAGITLLVWFAWFLHESKTNLWSFQVLMVLALTLLPAALVFSHRRARRAGVVVLLGFSLTVATVVVQRNLARSKAFEGAANLMPRMKKWQYIWTNIYKMTGWSYDEAIRRVYFVNHHMEQDARPGYEAFIHSGMRPFRRPSIDGFFVAFDQPTRFMSSEEVKRWLISQNIQEEIKLGLKKGAIFLGPYRRGPAMVIPYRTIGPDFPRYFQNHGQGYFPSAQALELEKVPGRAGAAEIADNQFLFKWNECPELNPFCSTGALVGLNRRTNRINVRVLGSAISQVSPWISPDWTQAWIDPYIEVHCGEKSEKFLLATSIGFLRRYAVYPSDPHLFGNNSLVAPVDREFHPACSEPIEEITIGRRQSIVETIYAPKTLPPQRLSLRVKPSP